MTTEPNKLEIIVAEQGLAPESAQALLTSYRPFFDQAHALIALAEAVRVTDATQVTEIKESRRIRLELVKIRTGADKLRRQMKEESLRRGKAIDGCFNILKFAIEPMEETLLAQEQFAERVEAERKSKLKLERESQLAPYGWDDTPGFNLAEMTQEDFEQLLENTIARHEAAIVAVQKAEADRIAKEKAEREEQERIRAENERLKKEADEREATLRRERQEAEAAQKAAEEKARQEKEAIEAKARAEREELERKAAAERAELEKRQQEEREAREKAEAELRQAQKAEAKRKSEHAEAVRNAANAPDKDKLLRFALDVIALIPQLSTPARTKKLEDQVRVLTSWIHERASEL